MAFFGIIISKGGDYMIDELIKYLSNGDLLEVVYVDGTKEIYSGNGKKIENNFLQVTSVVSTTFINLNSVESINVISKS